MKRKRGQQVTYTKTMGDSVCDELITGRTLRDVCRDAGMPPESTVRQWAMDDRGPGFAAQYARAREIGYHCMADEIIDISDKSVIGRKTKIDKDGNEETTTGDMIERSRLRVDTRKWMLSKTLPKIYGDKIEHTGSLKVVISKDDADL